MNVRLTLVVVAWIGFSATATAQIDLPKADPTANDITKGILRDAQGGTDKAAAAEKRAKTLQESMDLQFTPEELRKYRQFIQSRDRARAGLYSEEVVGRVRSLDVSPSRVGGIQDIRISASTTTTLVFTDEAGNPWKIIDEAIPSALAKGRRNGHMLTLLPPEGDGSLFGTGTLNIILDGGRGAIAFGLRSGLSKEIDAIVNIRVEGKNPSAPVVTMGTGTTLDNDPYFLNFLDGVPPDGAKALKTSSKLVEAWSFRGAVYVRTRLALHSPEFQLRSGSATGQVVYRFASNPSIVNAIDEGRVIPILLGES